MQATCPCCNHVFDTDSPLDNTKKTTPLDVIALYNEHAQKHKWQRVVKPGEALKKKLSTAIKELPSLDDWRLVMKGLESDKFFSGKNSDYKTKIDTLLFNSRYMTFYNAGLEAPTSSIDSFLDECKEFLA